MPGQATDWREVEDLVRNAESGGGTVGVTLIAPNGDRFSHHGERRFRAASTVKIPLMVAIYRQIDAGRRSLGDPYTLRAEDKAVGSGVLLHLHDGLQVTLNDLIYLMISISDDTLDAMLGGNVCRGLKARGLAGAVVDGAVRDVGEIRADGLPVFARGLALTVGPIEGPAR